MYSNSFQDDQVKVCILFVDGKSINTVISQVDYENLCNVITDRRIHGIKIKDAEGCYCTLNVDNIKYVRLES